VKNISVAPPEGSLLPTTSTGLYLHYHYIATGPKPYGTRSLNRSATDKSAYGQAVARYLPELSAVVDRLGLENITLVDPETMEVFFSIEQSAVLGTNLISGPYAASNMAALGRNLVTSRNVGDYKVADFESYRPALGSPKAFVGTPVFSGPRMSHYASPVQRTDRRGTVGQSVVEAEGWESPAKCFAGPRSDDADRFPISYRRSGRLH
jgi:hypothetical protein